MEKVLFLAAKEGDVETVRSILDNYPDVDVNWQNPKFDYSTCLHVSCTLFDIKYVPSIENQRDRVVTLLLSHPNCARRINVNLKNREGILLCMQHVQVITRCELWLYLAALRPITISTSIYLMIEVGKQLLLQLGMVITLLLIGILLLVDQ